MLRYVNKNKFLQSLLRIASFPWNMLFCRSYNGDWMALSRSIGTGHLTKAASVHCFQSFGLVKYLSKTESEVSI